MLDTPPGPVGAVVLPDLDGALRRPTLDAAEDTLRLACAVASWTVHGRADPAATEVVVQTREPQHHAVAALAAWDPGAFWRTEAAVRTALRFPPAASALRLALAAGTAIDALRRALPPGDDLLGPTPVDGRDGYLVKTDDRAASLAALRPLREAWSHDGIEVRVDVDPVDAA